MILSTTESADAYSRFTNYSPRAHWRTSYWKSAYNLEFCKKKKKNFGYPSLIKKNFIPENHIVENQ